MAPKAPTGTGRVRKANPNTYTTWEWMRGYAVLILLFPIYSFLWFMATFVRTLPSSITRKLLRAHERYTRDHPMDFRIPPDRTVPAYMFRWWRIARNWAMNIYYHIVLRSDDDRALHDHPWWNFSIVLDGGYFEHTIQEGGIHVRTWKGPGDMTFRWHGKKAHRLELNKRMLDDLTLSDLGAMSDGTREVIVDGDNREVEMPATTIFITGPVLRRWGFHHETGWVDAYDWDAFCAAKGIAGMRMDGGSDALVSTRNRHNSN